MRGRLLLVGVAVLSACPKPRPTRPSPVSLAVLTVESDRFPALAAAATSKLAKARVAGVEETKVSQVSIEVVQLSIECVEPTVACYEAAGKSLAANRLLFAQIAPAKKRAIQVTVTLFDVDTRTPRTRERLFATEREATAGLDGLVAEVTR